MITALTLSPLLFHYSHRSRTVYSHLAHRASICPFGLVLGGFTLFLNHIQCRWAGEREGKEALRLWNFHESGENALQSMREWRQNIFSVYLMRLILIVALTTINNELHDTWSCVGRPNKPKPTHNALYFSPFFFSLLFNNLIVCRLILYRCENSCGRALDAHKFIRSTHFC